MTQSFESQASPNTGGSEFNVQVFLIQQLLAKANIATLVRVVAVSNDDEISPVGTVDVVILVNQVDGAGNSVPHVPVYGLPYFRLQGGHNAIVLDPKVGDIGVAVFAHSDLSRVKATKAEANPATARRNSVSDGLYFGGVLNGSPVQYVRFRIDGIDLVDINENFIKMNGTGITVNGTVFYRDHRVWTDNEITAMTNHTVSQHTHSQGNDSHGDVEVDTNTPHN